MKFIKSIVCVIVSFCLVYRPSTAYSAPTNSGYASVQAEVNRILTKSGTLKALLDNAQSKIHKDDFQFLSQKIKQMEALPLKVDVKPSGEYVFRIEKTVIPVKRLGRQFGKIQYLINHHYVEYDPMLPIEKMLERISSSLPAAVGHHKNLMELLLPSSNAIVGDIIAIAVVITILNTLEFNGFECQSINEQFQKHGTCEKWSDADWEEYFKPRDPLWFIQALTKVLRVIDKIVDVCSTPELDACLKKFQSHIKKSGKENGLVK